MAKSEISVLAAGMVTAVGFNAASSLAAIRAKISGITESHLYDPEAGENMLAGKVDLPHWWEGLGKLVELIAPSIVECLGAVPAVEPVRIPILLAVASHKRPHRLDDMDLLLLEHLQHKLLFDLHPRSRLIAADQVAGLEGILAAVELIDSGEVEYCVVAGVDSYLQQGVVDEYLARRRLLTATNSNGFIPGEAGAAVLIGRCATVKGAALRLLGFGAAQEPAPIDSEEPFRAEGLTTAMRSGLQDAGLQLSDVDYRMTDLNGEHYKFKEASFPIGRLLKSRKEPGIDLWHPIEYLGEIGAAIGPCMLASALDAGMKDYAQGPTVLCHCSNDEGARVVVVARYEPAAGA